jgi:predicted alpha/beta superfamily hydrolase
LTNHGIPPQRQALFVGGNFKALHMHNSKLLVSVVVLFFISTTTYSQKPKVDLPGTELIRLKSGINNQDYVLNVYLPGSYSDTTKKFPVLYVLDGQWSFPYIAGVQGIAEGLFYDGLAPEMIVVGITWTGDYDSNRQRDFTPVQTNEFPNSGGAPKFFNVLRNEIVKMIDSSYRTDKVNNTLTGGSLGGLFTLYALFQKPQLFNRYIAWGFSGDDEISKLEKSFSEKNHELNAKIFLCTNEYEDELTDVSYFRIFIAQLKTPNFNKFEIDSLVIEKMGHVSEGPYAVGRGLEFVFRQPDVAIDTMLLDQYAGHYKRDYEIMNVTRIGSHIYIKVPGGKVKLYAKTTNSFYAKGLGGGVGQFVKDSSDKVIGYNLILDNVTIPYKKFD